MLHISNLVGFWYGVNFAEIPDTIHAVDTETISLEIKNMGYAPPYHSIRQNSNFIMYVPVSEIAMDTNAISLDKNLSYQLS